MAKQFTCDRCNREAKFGVTKAFCPDGVRVSGLMGDCERHICNSTECLRRELLDHSMVFYTRTEEEVSQ